MEEVQIQKSMAVRFIKTNEAERVVSGIVYTASDAPDGQGDMMDATGVMDAMLTHARKKIMKVQHAGPDRAGGDVQVLESYMTGDGVTEINGQKIPPHSWVMTSRLSPVLFEKVLAGKITGYSMSGSARVEVVSEGRKSQYA